MMVLMLVRCVATNISSPMATRLSLMISSVNGSSRVWLAFDRRADVDRLALVLTVTVRFAMSDLLNMEKTVCVHGERLAGKHHGDGGRFFDHRRPVDPLPGR